MKALDRVSLEVSGGVVHGIVGENGAGKSTLMKILSGVYEKDSGEVVFEGRTIDKITPLQSMRMGLAIIYQELNLVNTMTVGENVFLGRFSESGGRRGVHAKARKLLDSIGSKVSTYRMVSELSVSDKQMVEIAKALSFDSKLIIMDEPSSSLTADEMEKLVKIIHDLKSKGIAIIYISHKLDEILGFCDVVTVMRDGRVIDTRPVSEMSRNQMISMMVGRTIENEFPPRPESAGETILEIKHINTRKLKDVQLTLRKGEILGLVGLVGSGRTELVRALFGADKIAKKSIYLDGKPVEINNPIDAINLGLALVPEDRKLQGLLLGFSVEQNISLAVLIRLTTYGFIDAKKRARSATERSRRSTSRRHPARRGSGHCPAGMSRRPSSVGGWR